MKVKRMRWQAIPGLPGYEASTTGLIRSVDRIVISTTRGPQRLRGRVLRVSSNPVSGRRQVTVSVEGRPRTYTIAPLVLAAFCGRGNGLHACHNNDIPTDDRLENLRWDTRAGNMQDVINAGRHNHAGKTHCKNGHEFTPQNTYVNGRKRVCRVCSYAAILVYRRRVAATQS